MPATPHYPQAARSPAVERPSRARSVAAIICLVLAGLLTTPAAVAYWGQRTLNDTDRYVATVEPLVNSPEVQDVIATKVTNAIEQQVDIEAILNDEFADLWIGVNTRAQRALQRVLKGEGTGASCRRARGHRRPARRRPDQSRGPVGCGQPRAGASSAFGPSPVSCSRTPRRRLALHIVRVMRQTSGCSPMEYGQTEHCDRS